MTEAINESNFNIILGEADAHFTTGRYVDAAKTFEHLSTEALKGQKYEDMLYFIYRALLSWKHSSNPIKIIKLYQKLALFSLKYSTKIAQEYNLELDYSLEKLNILQIIQNNLNNMNKIEEKAEIQNEIITVSKYILDKEKTFDKKIEIIHKTLPILEELNLSTDLLHFKSVEAKTLEKEGDYQLKHANFDPVDIARRYYEKSIQIWEEIQNTKSIRRVRSKLNKL